MKNQKEQKTQCKTKAVRSQRIAWMLRNEGFPVMRNNEEELTKKDIYMLMVEEFISHPYLCEREPVEIACAYACGVKRKVSGSNPGDAA